MPFARLADATLYYTVDGPDDAPALVLSNSLGCDVGMWSAQVARLSRHFRVLRYDTRGHGLSTVVDAPFGFAELASDVVQLMDHVGMARAHFCGISMGGLTGIALAAAHPARVDRLILSNTAARIGSVESWGARIDVVRSQGLWQLAPSLVERWVSADFRQSRPEAVQSLLDMLRRTTDRGYIASCAALQSDDWTSRLSRIASPTLVIAGTSDLATTPAQGRALHHAIRNSAYVELAASHLSNWEQPDEFLRAASTFLGGGAHPG